MGLSAASVSTVAGTQPDAVLSLDVQHRWERVVGTDSPALNLSVEDRAEAERRFTVIEPLAFRERFEQLWQDCKGRKLAVVHALAVEHARPARTIRHWFAQYTRHGMLGLVNRDRADKGTFKLLNQAAAKWIRAEITPKRGSFGALSINETYRAYEEERVWRDAHMGQTIASEADKYLAYLDEDRRLSEKGRLPAISLRTLRRFVDSIPEAARTLARDGEEAYRNTQEIISHRALSEIEPLQILVMDHRVLDVFCMIPERGGWRLARPWLTAAIDMRTRRWLGWGVFETPSSDSIATVLKKVLIGHGVPKSVYWDNGKDFRCEYLEGRHVRTEQAGAVGDLDPAWRGVMGTLGIRVTHAIVRNPRAKPIESNFNRISNFDRQLPEWCGHKPGARPERFDALVKQHEAWTRGERPASPFRTIQQIATLYEAVIEDLNERELEGEGMQKATPHGRGWMSPSECWDMLIGRVERRTVRTEDLHIIFSKRRMLTVKHGEIRAIFGGQHFYYRLEAEPVQLMAINGQLVEIAYDPNDLGHAAVYWRDQFIGIAHCVQLRKMGDDSFVEDEKNRRAARREIKRAIESVHKDVYVAGPEERLARRREVMPLREPAARVEVQMALPAPMQAAADAEAKDRAFSFDAAQMIDIDSPNLPADGADEFIFFSSQGD